MAVRELDEKGWIFLGNDGNPYRCCMWGAQPWLFWWHPDHTWVSMRPLTLMDVFLLPNNLTQEQQEHYYRLEAETAARLAPKPIEGKDHD